jgi:radical SAM protein with 4Fe4S-binding SPASM domain
MSRPSLPDKSVTHQYERVNIEIISTCNLKCSFCPSGESPKSVMTPSQFYQIIHSLQGRTKEVVLHLLGEPLTHPELDGILSAAADAQMPINIVTNGLLLHEKSRELLLRPIVRQVSISLQSFTDNFKGEKPDLYLKRIKKFADEALQRRPDLYLNLRFWDLKNWAEAVDQDADLMETDNQILRRLLSEVFQFQWADVQVDLKRKKNHRLRGRQYLHFDSRFVWPSLKNEVLQTKGFCHGLSGHFGIHADGTVVPCCLDHNADVRLGNVFTSPIEDILESKRALAMLEGFSRRVLVEELCKRCGFISRFN